MAEGQTIILSGPRQRELAKKLIDAAGERYVVTITPEKRSNPQNAKMHAMISDIARAKPQGRVHPPLVWKCLLMADADFKPWFERSLDDQGIVPIGFKSSRLTKVEFSGLIENIYAYGAKHNVPWSVD